MSSPHLNTAQHFDAPYLPLRKASPQLLQPRRDGPRPLFAPGRGGFNPRPVQPIPKVDPRNASSDNAFLGREDRRPYKQPWVQQQPQQSKRELHSQQHLIDSRERLSPSTQDSNGAYEPKNKLRSSRSVGDSLRVGDSQVSQSTSHASGRLSFESGRNGSTMYGEIRSSLRSALTGSSRVNSSSVNTVYSSAVTDFSSSSDLVYSTPKMTAEEADDDGRSSFDVEDAIGLYEDGFESASESLDIPRPKLSLDIRPTTSTQPRTRPNMMHRRSQSASILLGRTQSTRKLDPLPALPAESEQLPVPPANVPRDRYGFKTVSHHVTAYEYDAWNRGYTEHLERRRRKWNAMLKSYGLSTENPIRFPPKSEKIKRYIRKGIPPEWRGAAWFWYAGGPYLLRKQPDVYRQLLQDVQEGKLSDNDREHIERDLNRTFPDNIRFKPNPTSTMDMQDGAGGGRASAEPEASIISALRRVLQAFAVHNPSIGYCQSLNFIAGLLLLFLDEDEEKSFILLEQVTSLHLPGTHGVTLEGANIDIAVLMSCIKDNLPSVWAKLDDKGDVTGLSPMIQTLRLPTVSLATTAWFMSLFVGTLPVESVLRVWDCLFFEGSKTLFRVALAIFKAGEKKIVATQDPMEIFQVVQGIPRSMLDINGLLEVCFRRRGGFGYMSQDIIERRRTERRREVQAGIANDDGLFKKFKTRLRSRTAKN